MNFFKTAGILVLAAVAFGCSRAPEQPVGGLPATMKEIPSARLNFRYEADVPKPEEKAATQSQELNPSVQIDFDQNRPQELLDKTIGSLDGKRTLAVYHRVGDLPAEFRLDMYTPDGRLLRKMTADTMAVHFPETIVWSPNSENVAFVAMLRGTQTAPPETAAPPPAGAGTSSPTDANTVNSDTGQNADANTAPAAAAPATVLTFRTEQIYLASADGDGVKPITQNEGLIYFYYVWSPDSSMLASMATTGREWQFLQASADAKGENYVPVGRPRLVEKNGRERRLDDGITAVQPVWSPDSSKVAVGYGTQVRIYDAYGNAPTQAAIPLRNSLLISSRAYDREQETKLQAANTAPDANVQQTPAPETPATLPDESSLVSYNPIVALSWSLDNLLYFQTAYIKRMKNEADSVTSFPRWHRLVFTPQPTVAGS